MDGKLTTLTSPEIEIKRKLLEITKTLRMNRIKLQENKQAERQVFEKTFKQIIEPLKSLATMRKEKEEESEALEQEEDTFEDAADDVLGDMIKKQLANLRDFPNEFDTTYGQHYNMED